MVQHLPLSVRVPIEEDNPSIRRNEALCIKCGMCKEVCTQQIGVHGTYTLEETGGGTYIVLRGYDAAGELVYTYIPQ